MSGTWSDGRREPLLEYFDARRGYKAQRPKPRKDRPAETVFPFGTGQSTGRTTFDTLAAVPDQIPTRRKVAVMTENPAFLPARPVLTLRSAARAASYGPLK
jgi:hypothetical protein